MTKPLSFTQAGLKRAILAARSSGLRVTGIKPDGTLIVDDGGNSPGIVPGDIGAAHGDAPSDQWGEVEA